MRPPVDVRLVPSVATAWLAALAVARMDWRQAVLLGALLLVTGVSLLAVGRAGDPGPRRGSVALALGVAAAVLLVGGVQQHTRHVGLLARAVAGAWVVEVEGRLDAPPAPIAGTDRCRYRIGVHLIEAHGSRARAAAPVEVQAPCAGVDVGAQVMARGRLGAPVRPGRVVASLRSGAAPAIVDPPRGLEAVAASVRVAAGQVAAQVPGDAGALLPAIAWGDTSRLPEGLTQAMQGAGLTHVTAVSGAHFALVSSLVLTIGAVVRAPRGARAAATVLVGAGLLLLVGAQPSVLRAAVMGAVAVVGLLVGRPAGGPAALSVAVVGLLVVDPWLAGEPGFALSVAATAGIVLLAPPLVERWAPVVGRGPAALAAIPIVAQAACAPLLLPLSPTVATWAVPANLAAAPAIGPATVLGLGSALLAPWWPAAAGWLAHAGAAACGWVVAVARTAAGAPGAGLAWLPGVVGVLAMVAVGAGTVGLLLRPSRHGRVGECHLDAALQPEVGRPDPRR